MSEEIKINKNNKSITFINNGIGFSQFFGVADEILDLITNLQTQLQQKENIINEVREYNDHLIRDAKYHLNEGHLKKMKKILDKENQNEKM